MKILLAAGGTAGHVNPALAIAQGIKEKWPNAEIFFAGRGGGMEKRLVEQAGYPFYNIEVRGLQRSLSPKSMAKNLSAAWHLAFAPGAAKRIIKKVNPVLVVGTGGYVSGPVLQKAVQMGIKTAIHEQNAMPGITNKLLAKQVNLVFAPTQSAVARLGAPEKTLVAGSPVRTNMALQTKEEAQSAIGANGRRVLLSYGGSLGAMKINQMVAKLAAWHIKNRNFLHIHATGSIEKEDFDKAAEQMGLKDKDNFRICEYIDDMPTMLAAAELVICRAGALTLAELAAVGRASILIPSPNVAENHQYYNALEFEENAAACVFEEKTLDAQLLIDTVDTLTKDDDTLLKMGEAAKKLARPNALQIILEALANLLENP